MRIFRVGDRVRLGHVRGGVVVQHDGRLRVRFGDARQLLWLDHCVPDEGPDGRIFPNTWHECQGCGNPTIQHIFCSNCDRRSLEDAKAFDEYERRRENEGRIQRGLPSIGTHVAGPVVHGTYRSPCSPHLIPRYEQRCARCNVVLISGCGEYRRECPPGVFAEGALIQSNRMWIGLPNPNYPQPTEPTCTPVREAVSA